MEKMNIAQEETIAIIFNLLKSIWGKTLVLKARRLSMGIPTKRSCRNDSETKNGSNPQKIKNKFTPTNNPTDMTNLEITANKEDLDKTPSSEHK